MVQLLSSKAIAFLLFVSLVAAAPASVSAPDAAPEAAPDATPEAAPDAATKTCPPSAVNAATLSLIEGFEGWRASPYKDAVGLCTIGWGHQCSSSSCHEIGYKIPLSKANGAKLLDKDLLIARTCITKQIKSTVKLNPDQYGALVSWAFNVGCGASSSSTLIEELNENKSVNTVCEQQLPRWTNGGLPGLVRRREAEVALCKEKAPGVAHPPHC